MTTELRGQNTFFLPFNKGINKGAGNPVNPNGYRTAYLWEDVLVKDSLMDIIERFMHLEIKEDKETGKKKESLIFPRYHQLDVVSKAAVAMFLAKNFWLQTATYGDGYGLP